MWLFRRGVTSPRIAFDLSITKPHYLVGRAAMHHTGVYGDRFTTRRSIPACLAEQD